MIVWDRQRNLPLPGLIYGCLGILIGLIIRGGIDGESQFSKSQATATTTITTTEGLKATPTEPFKTATAGSTAEPNVMIIVTNTAEPTEMPTNQPTSIATTDVHADDCDRITPSPKEGSLCRKPPGPTETSTVPAPCPTAEPGKICSWVQA